MGGAPTVLLIMLLLMLGQVLAVLANIWLAQWSRMTSQDQQGDYVMNIYILLVLFTLAGAFLRSLVFFHFAIIAAESIYNSMLLCVLRAPVLFCDSNPHGRILNRFSRDIGVIDYQLPSTVYDFFQCTLMVCAGESVIERVS
jgi:ATP-binding cassette subfamily C (CFTR/MRP) protein 4